MNRILIAVLMLILGVPAFAAAQDVVKVKFETTQGDFIVEVHREWAPLGADRFLELVRAKYYDGCRFFRVIKGFMAQFGINGDPKVTAAWRGNIIKDDPVKESNKRGYVTFAKTNAPNSRGTQLFINLVDNSNLDSMGFAPIGKVVEGMEIVEKLFSGYGDGPPRGQGPDQGQMTARGEPYLAANFTRLDSIKKATIIP